MRHWGWLAFLFAPLAFAQNPNPQYIVTPTNPNGTACTYQSVAYQYNGIIYTCSNGSTYTAQTGGSTTPGTTTNSLTGAASGGAAPGTTFNGASAVTFDYHTLGAVPLAGGSANEMTGSLYTLGIETGTENGAYHPAACGVLVTAPSWCSGSDFGAWFNAAYAAVVTSAVNGTIVIDPGSYTYSTPIVANNAGTRLAVVGSGASLTFSASSGTAMQFGTNTSGGIAVTGDDFSLTCSASANTAIGIQVGTGLNSPAVFSHINMAGCKFPIETYTYRASFYDLHVISCSSAAGSIGVQTVSTADETLIVGGSISSCATLLSNANANPIWVVGTADFNNATSTWVSNLNSGMVVMDEVHFYNQPSGATTLWANNNGTMVISDSRFEDGGTTGSITSAITNSGGNLTLSNDTLGTSGITYTEFVNPSSGTLAFNTNINLTPTQIPLLWTSGYSGTVTVNGIPQLSTGGQSLSLSSLTMSGVTTTLAPIIPWQNYTGQGTNFSGDFQSGLWQPSRNIKITQVLAYSPTTGTCTIQPILSLKQGSTTLFTMTTTNAVNAWAISTGTVPLNVTASSGSLQWTITTAGTCATNPGPPATTVEYQMQ